MLTRRGRAAVALLVALPFPLAFALPLPPATPPAVTTTTEGGR